MIASTLAGCTTVEEADARADDERISDLESAQLDLALELADQKLINSDLAISLSQIEAANMQAIEALDTNYQQLLLDLEENYTNTINSLVSANSQTLEEINQTNAAAYTDLLSTMTILENNLVTSQDSINTIILTIDDMDSDDSGDTLAQILLLQQALQDLQLELELSIAELDSRLNMTRAMNDFSYLDFRGAQLFNFNNGLGVQMEPPIFDFAMLDNASLTYSNFSDASFVNANLVGADGIFSTFHRTDFSSAQMYQGIWRQSDFSDALFVGSQLAYTEFRYSDLSGANLSGAVMYGGSDWLMVNLSGADLTNAWMYDVDLRYADLTGANLTGAKLAYLNPSYGPADITGVTWTNAICPDGTHASTVGDTCANNL